MIKHILKLFKRNRQGEHLTDELRQKALEVRQLNSKVAQLEKQAILNKRLEILERGILTPSKDGSGNEEAMFMNILMAALNGNKQIVNTQPLNTSEATTSEIPRALSDEQILLYADEIKNRVPQIKSLIGNTTEGDILALRKEVLK